jgi:dTDP-glucose 4,6-dehydratase
LVTGGAGFIGTNFVHFWLREHPGDRVVVLDALTYAGNAANLAPAQERVEFRFVHGDICDNPLVEQLMRTELTDTIVHFAAETHVDRSIVSSDAFLRTNVLGTHSLLEAARRVWLKDRAVGAHLFHHVSTDEVYGSLGPHDPPFTESSRHAPNSPYAASKAASDHLVRAYHHTYGLSTTISNCSNNYGPYQFPEKLIPLLIACILGGRPLPIYGDGRNVRDWLHVADHCRAIERILTAGRAGEVYNVGGESERENLAVVHAICTHIDLRLGESAALRRRFPNSPASAGGESRQLIEFVADRPGHDRRYAIDARKIATELGFAPLHTLEQGLGEVIDWYLQEENVHLLAVRG